MLYGTPGFFDIGWNCVHVEDLNPDGMPMEEVNYSTCQACDHYPIRFVHYIKHPGWDGLVKVGRICVEKLTGDFVGPKLRESGLQNRANARARWIKRKWRISAKGNPWIKVNGHHIVVFRSDFNGRYQFCADGEFDRETFVTEDEAKLAAFDVSWKP